MESCCESLFFSEQHSGVQETSPSEKGICLPSRWRRRESNAHLNSFRVESITLIFSGCSRPLPRCAEEGLFSGTWIVWRTLWCRCCRTQPPWVFFSHFFSLPVRWKERRLRVCWGFISSIGSLYFPVWRCFRSALTASPGNPWLSSLLQGSLTKNDKNTEKQRKKDQPLVLPGQCGAFYFERKSEVTWRLSGAFAQHKLFTLKGITTPLDYSIYFFCMIIYLS